MYYTWNKCLYILHGKNDFAKGSKILLDTDLKIIFLNYRNNFVGTLKIMSNAAKNFDILATVKCEQFSTLF